MMTTVFHRTHLDLDKSFHAGLVLLVKMFNCFISMKVHLLKMIALDILVNYNFSPNASIDYYILMNSFLWSEHYDITVVMLIG